jgi:hypothetical protein
MVDPTTPRVRNLPTHNIPRLESTGNNRAPWSIVFRSVCRSQGFDSLLTTATNHTTSDEVAADRIVHHLLVSTIDHSIGSDVVKLATSHQAWSFLQQVGLTTSTYDVIAAKKTPTLHASTSTNAFLQAHRNQRNAILNLSPDDLFATPLHSIQLILEGLPEHDSEVKLLQKEFSKTTTVTVQTIEELHTQVLALEYASASTASSRPRFKARRQGERSSRRIFHQPPGNPKLKYSCQYCLADGHKEEVCFMKRNAILPSHKPARSRGRFCPSCA